MGKSKIPVAPKPPSRWQDLPDDLKMQIIEMLAEYNPEALRTEAFKDFIFREDNLQSQDPYDDVLGATYPDPLSTTGVYHLGGNGVQVGLFSDDVPRTAAHESIHEGLDRNHMPMPDGDFDLRNDHNWMATVLPELMSSYGQVKRYTNPDKYKNPEKLPHQREVTQEIYDRMQAHNVRVRPRPDGTSAGTTRVNTKATKGPNYEEEWRSTLEILRDMIGL